ncbi:MAG: CAP domain-containing protein [Acidimicrobiales bacterium]
MTSPSPTLRRRQLGALGIVVVALSLLAACMRVDQTAALGAMNADRGANRLGRLGTQYDAQHKAQAWADKLAHENRLYHSNLADGINVRWCSIGENVGYGPSIPAIENAFMNSAGHRANILDSKWNGVGVGVAYSGNTVYTVQVFIKTC